MTLDNEKAAKDAELAQLRAQLAIYEQRAKEHVGAQAPVQAVPVAQAGPHDIVCDHVLCSWVNHRVMELVLVCHYSSTE